MKRYAIITALLLLFLFAVFGAAYAGATTARAHEVVKKDLPRDDVYYEITNDHDDHGNFWETYHVPLPDGRILFCVVYSDQMKGGGGAGPSCDWAHARRP